MAEFKMSHTMNNFTKQGSSSQLITSESNTEQYINEKSNILDNLSSILPYATLRTRQLSLLPTEEHVNALTTHLRLNTNLIQDDPKSHKLRMETLKAMPQSLTIKRSVKSKLQASVTQGTRLQTISYWKWLKYRSSYTFSKIHTIIRDSAPSLEFWYQTIKSIEGRYGSGIAAYFKFLRWLICLNVIACILSVCFIILPQSLKQTHARTSIAAWDILTGSGFFSNTILYYGFYTNGTVEQVPALGYNIPSAYFITLLCSYTLILIILSIKVAASYRKSYIEFRGNVQNMYSNKIFCGWDFSISSSVAANVHSESIYRELKELLAEAIQQRQFTCTEKLVTFIIRAVVTIFIILIIGGTAVLLWYLLQKHEMDVSNALSLMVVPIVVTSIMQIFPAIISKLARCENYKNKRAELTVTVIRIHAMAATVIGTHLAFWFQNTEADCWQTKLGEEIYRLVLLDFIVATCGECLFEAIRLALYDKGWKWVGRSEFDIARSTLNLIYNQTLFWLGFYFSPFMSVIIFIKMILIFYFKKYGLRKYYEPLSRPWRAAQTETLFLALAFLGMVSVLTALGYIISYIESDDCGPFRAHDSAWDFVINGIFSLEKDSQTRKVLSELMSPATGTAVLVSMCIGVYWLRAKVEASKEMLHILREMLIMQSRDKEFLMRSLTKISTGRTVSEHNTSCSPSKESTPKPSRYVAPTPGSGKSSQESRRRNATAPNRHQEDLV